MGPIWGLQDPAGTHVGPMNFAIWFITKILLTENSLMLGGTYMRQWTNIVITFCELNLKMSSAKWVSFNGKQNNHGAMQYPVNMLTK